MTDIVDILTRTLGKGAVLSREEVAQRAVSYWDNSPMVAKAMVRPTSTQEVSKVLNICHDHNQTIFTHGGNTTCVQGTTTSAENIVLSLERMNKIVEIDPVSSTATLEAGAILEIVQNAVKKQELFLPLDLGARGSCTIGGNLATNAGGVNVLRFGMARAMVLGLEAVLADGTIISSMDKMLKNNAGYDLKQLFIGTEGTLGVITRLIVKLVPQPTTKQTAMVALQDFASVIWLLTHLKKQIGTNLSAFEVMWGNYLKAVTEPGWHSSPMDRTHPFYILLECDGNDPARDEHRFMEVIEAAFEEGYIRDAVIPKSETERQSLWAIRDDFEAILHPKPVYLYDVSLSITDMESYVDEVKCKLLKLMPQSKSYVLGHVGDGNLHFFVQPGLEGSGSRELSDRAVYEPLRKYSGSVSAEHGIGFEKKHWLAQSRSSAEIKLMKLLKNALDPKNILNPGIIIN